LDVESGLRSKMAHSLLGAECYLSVSAVLVRSLPSLIPGLSSPTSEVLNSINKVQTEVVWQILMLDDVKSDMEEGMEELSCSTTLSASLGSGSRR
jgi:E3 ubiquitin-protein ligase HUWE1